MFKKVVRKIVRGLCGSRKNETIADSIDRKKYRLIKKINRQTFSTKDLKSALISLGLSRGDMVIVHASWRSFVGYDGGVDDVIRMLLDIVGEDGAVIMPAYTNSKESFKYDDPSAAGYMSEVFRVHYSNARSLSVIFSMCACGKDADKITKNHIDSEYAFDEKSPYSMAVNRGAKILLMGLGKKPHKITLFHCVTYALKNVVKCYDGVYDERKDVVIYDKNNKEIKKQIIDRKKGVQNNKRKFRKLFQVLVPVNNYRRLNKLDLYLFNSKEIYDETKRYIIENNFNLYKKTS